MPVEIKEVKTKSDLKKYVKFPFYLYRDDPLWTPPLFCDEYSFYNPEKNKNMASNPHILLLAFRDGRLVGRIMGLINESVNIHKNEKLLRWAFLDSIDDADVVSSLLGYVESWGREKGMERAVGPRGFSDQEPQGAIVEGFGERAAIGTNYNRPYLIKHLEGHGYKKEVDWVCYKIVIPEGMPDFYQNIISRKLKSSDLRLKTFSSKKELKPYIMPILDLLNETYRDIYGFSPLSEEEKKNLVKKYLPVLDPGFLSVIEGSGQLIAFSISLPDITEGMRKARGRLFPFGIFHILRASKKSKVLQFLLVGIKERYRGHGLFPLFAINLRKVTAERGMMWVDSHLQLEDNYSIRKWMEKLEGKVYRRYRAFKMNL